MSIVAGSTVTSGHAGPSVPQFIFIMWQLVRERPVDPSRLVDCAHFEHQI